jgi:hypothetical protein
MKCQIDVSGALKPPDEAGQFSFHRTHDLGFSSRDGLTTDRADVFHRRSWHCAENNSARDLLEDLLRLCE